MTREKPIEIEISEKIKVKPEFIYKGQVVKSGNGASIKSYKQFIGKQVYVIVADKVEK